MILTLRIECVFGMYFKDECVRIIEIDEEASLYDLHEAIQDAVHFDRDQLFGFYIANSWRGKKLWLSESDEWEDRETEICEIKLKDVFPVGRKKLHYLFDFGDDWTFQVRRSRKKPREPEVGIKYPRVIDRIGPDPEQYPEDGF